MLSSFSRHAVNALSASFKDVSSNFSKFASAFALAFASAPARQFFSSWLVEDCVFVSFDFVCTASRSWLKRSSMIRVCSFEFSKLVDSSDSKHPQTHAQKKSFKTNLKPTETNNSGQ